MPNDPHDNMLPPTVEDHEREAFKQEMESDMRALAVTCCFLVVVLILIVVYFLIRAGGAT